MTVDTLQPPYQNPIQNFVHRLRTAEPVHEPLSPAICRIGQQIVDTAVLSAQEKRAMPLVER
jgi:glucose-fructose oxidoreductase